MATTDISVWTELRTLLREELASYRVSLEALQREVAELRVAVARIEGRAPMVTALEERVSANSQRLAELEGQMQRWEGAGSAMGKGAGWMFGIVGAVIGAVVSTLLLRFAVPH